MDIDQSRVKAFETPEALGGWLALHHGQCTEIWVKIFKKHSGQRSVTWQDCVIEAIAWGWIDGIKKSLDAQTYVQRLTPRKAGSGWSTRNCAHAEKLMASNRMQPAGQRVVELAKASGSWDNAYSGQANMQFPQDFLQALDDHPDSKTFFTGLTRANQFAIYHRLHTAKRPQTRADRMTKILAMLARHEKFHG